MRPATTPLLLAGLTLALAAQSDPLAPRTKGRADAPLTIYEMSDFQCPYCRQFAVQTFPQLEREYLASGKARLVYINFPIAPSHPNAGPAAEAALCAARQGRDGFWALHDALFQRQAEWARLPDPGAFFTELARGAGLDTGAFSRCLRTGETRAEVESDRQASVRAGAQGTPTFYVEGYLIRGSAPIEEFRWVLDSLYRVKTATRSP